MKLITQNKPQCLLYSFAMCLDVEPETLIEEVGHDGLPDGFHYQEFYQSCTKRGFVPLVLDLFPVISTKPNEPIWDIERCMDEAQKYLDGNIAVMLEPTHAVAKDDSGIIYDPKGKKYYFSWERYKTAIVLIRESNLSK